MWDHIDIKGDIRIKDLIDYFKTQFKLKVTMIGYDVVTIYSNFLSQEKKNDRLEKTVIQAYEEIKKEKFPSHVKVLQLAVSCYDMNDDDVDIPMVRYTLN